MNIIRLSGNVNTLGNKSINIKRGAILGLALVMNLPDYKMSVKGDDDASTATIVFDDNDAQIVHTFNTELNNEQILGYVAEAKITDAVGFKDFDTKVANGTFEESFGTGYALAPTKKIARLGFKNGQLIDLPLDGLQDLHIKDDGIRAIANNTAYFIASTDLVNWLQNPLTVKLKKTKVGQFKETVTVISRPTNADVYYVSGQAMSYQVRWNGTFEILDAKPTGTQVLGRLADDDDTLVFGTCRNTSDGLTSDLTFKQVKTTGRDLGYDQSISS